MKSIIKKIVVSILTFEAKAALSRHKPKIVAITGNVGKTSTKDAIYAVLERAFGAGKVRKSQKSMNSEIGLPLAILGLENAWSSAALWARNIKDGFAVAFFGKNFPEWLVLEVGADHPGDIETISKWLRPDIAVLTRMSPIPVHVEFFKDAEAVLREKMFLAEAVKTDGVVVVNADDPYFTTPVQEIVNKNGLKKVTYGTTKGSEVEIVNSETLYSNDTLPLPVGVSATLKIDRKEFQIELDSVLGAHLAYPLAAASAVADILGVESSIPSAFRGFKSPNGRMRILKGINSSAIIDDTYNSSPLACAEALNTLAGLSIRGRKIAALADMKELGKNAEKAHRDIGKLAGETVHTLITVGEMSKFIAEGARAASLSPDNIFSFETSAEAGKILAPMIRAGDVVLVKGSQSMRMERVSKALLANPEKSASLLVRQEPEWLKK